MKSTTASSQLIDEKVILTMITCSVLALMVLAFRYVNPPSDFPVSISVKDSTLFTDELIQFTAKGSDIETKSLIWDFGDNSNQYDKNIIAVHKFSSAGPYIITLTINGNRHEYKTVYITKAIPPVDKHLIPQFIGPDQAIKGEPVTFKDFTSNAIKWEWWFGEKTSAIPDATAREVKYTFKEEGFKTVTLVVNDNMIGKLRVYIGPKPIEKPANTNRGKSTSGPIIIVKDKPDTRPINNQTNPVGTQPPPVTPKDSATKQPPAIARGPDITEDQLGSMLKKVVEGDKNASDFSKYMNGNLNISVYSNGKGMTFNSFCVELKEIKKSKNLKMFKVVNVEKDQMNYIKSMIIKYETYGMFGRIVH